MPNLRFAEKLTQEQRLIECSAEYAGSSAQGMTAAKAKYKNAKEGATGRFLRFAEKLTREQRLTEYAGSASLDRPRGE